MEAPIFFEENLGHSKDITIIRRPKKILFSGKTDFAEVIIAEGSFGEKEIYIDKILQSSTRDEFVYHEALVHPAMSRFRPESVLIIGGGEGAVAREVLKHPVERVDMVEIDGTFVELVKKYVPEMPDGAFDDERLNLHIADAWDFVKGTSDRWDLAIVDITEPEGPARRLYTREFYEMLGRVTDNVSVFAGELDGLFEGGYQARYISTIRSVFSNTLAGTIYVPSFLTSILVVLASKDPIPSPTFSPIQTRVYDEEADKHIFSLPKHLRERVNQDLPPFTLENLAEY